MKAPRAWRAIFATAATAALLASAAPDGLFSQVESTLAELSRIAALPVKRQVPAGMISRGEINRYLQDRVKEEVKPEELRAEQMVLVKFGLVPAEFDLVKSTVNLLTEQAAAFYDFKAKKLFVSDWASTGMQQAALVHELAHAIADQSFNLERFIESASKNDDSSLARMAVMEGQASWLMTEVMARRAGRSLRDSPEMVEEMSRASGGEGQFPEFDKSPLYIRESLLFPYTAGITFQHAVFLKMDQQAFTEVFRRPPVSSQQILHPEKYFAGVTPTKPALPALPETGFKRIAEGTVGELDFSVLLRQYAGREAADEVAPHWRGGQYRLYERKPDRRSVLAFSSEWDSEQAAARLFELYQRVLRGKWKKMEARSAGEGVLEGEGDDGRFVLRRAGALVTSLEGLSPAAPR